MFKKNRLTINDLLSLLLLSIVSVASHAQTNGASSQPSLKDVGVSQSNAISGSQAPITISVPISFKNLLPDSETKAIHCIVHNGPPDKQYSIWSYPDISKRSGVGLKNIEGGGVGGNLDQTVVVPIHQQPDTSLSIYEAINYSCRIIVRGSDDVALRTKKEWDDWANLNKRNKVKRERVAKPGTPLVTEVTGQINWTPSISFN